MRKIVYLLFLIFVLCSCNPNKEYKSSTAEKLAVPRFVGSQIATRSIADNSETAKLMYYMQFPLISGFEEEEVEDNRSQVIVAGKVITLSIMKNNGVIIYSGISDDKTIELRIEYNIEAKSFNYEQALIGKGPASMGSFEFLSYVQGRDLRIDSDGSISGSCISYMYSMIGGSKGAGEIYSNSDFAGGVWFGSFDVDSKTSEEQAKFVEKLKKISMNIEKTNIDRLVELMDGYYKETYTHSSNQLFYFTDGSFNCSLDSISDDYLQKFVNKKTNNKWKISGLKLSEGVETVINYPKWLNNIDANSGAWVANAKSDNFSQACYIFTLDDYIEIQCPKDESGTNERGIYNNYNLRVEESSEEEIKLEIAGESIHIYKDKTSTPRIDIGDMKMVDNTLKKEDN